MKQRIKNCKGNAYYSCTVHEVVTVLYAIMPCDFTVWTPSWTGLAHFNNNKNALSSVESRLFVDKIRNEEANRAHINGLEMLVVLLRGVNFGFCSHLRCYVLGKTLLYLAVKVSFRVACEKI